MHEDWLAVGGPLRAQLFGIAARVEIAVYEVGDDVDGSLDIEVLEGLRQEVFRYGGDTIALLDGEAGNRQIAAIAAHQGNVRAMQRGHKGQAARRGHRTREHGAD